MNVRILEHVDHRIVCTNLVRSPVRCVGLEAPQKSDITALSTASINISINMMTCGEVVGMTRVAHLPAGHCKNLIKHRPFDDHTVPTRPAHLAQRWCRSHGPGSLEAKDVV